MSLLHDLKLLFPDSMESASNMAKEYSDSIILAGGTDLIPKLKRGQFSPTYCISLEKIRTKFQYMEKKENYFSMGALTPLWRLEENPDIQAFPAFLQAIKQVASPTLRNQATLGGNLLQDTRCKYVDKSELWRESVGFCLKRSGKICRVAPKSFKCLATFCSDIAPALMVLDGEMIFQKLGESTVIPISKMYHDNGQCHLKKDSHEILKEIRIPLSSSKKSIYKKLRLRQSLDFPEMGVAVSLEANLEEWNLKVAYTALSSHIPFFHKVIPVFKGREGLLEWIEEIYLEIKPKDTMFTPPLYRKKVAKNFLKTALFKICKITD